MGGDEISRIKGFRDAARRKYNSAISEMAQLNLVGHVHGKNRGKLQDLLNEANKYFHEWCAYDSALKIFGEVS